MCVAMAPVHDPKTNIEALLAAGHESLLSAIVTQSPYGVIVSDPDGRLILQNAAATKIWAGSAIAETVEGWGQYRAFHPDGRPYEPGDWSMAKSLRELKVTEATETHFQRFDGTHGVLLGGASPILGPTGELLGAVSIFADVTRLREAEAGRTEASERLRLMADVGTLVSEGLESTTMLARLAKLCVPGLSDWSAVDVLNEQGRVQRVAVEHADPKMVKWAQEIEERYPSDPNSATGVPNVLRSGATEYVREIPEELLIRSAKDAEHLRLILSLEMRSYIVVPLQARGRILGAVSLVRSRRVFEPADVLFAQELANRAALLLDNQALYKASQEALHHAELEKREREKLIVALERSNSELHQFAYAASHDLKAPLRAVVSLSHFIEEDLGDKLSPEGKKHMALLQSRVQRMQGLIDGILSYSRAGQIAEKRELVDVGELLLQMQELMSPPKAARIVIKAGLPKLKTEFAPLQQVFMNLVGNAMKHSGRPDPVVEISGRDLGTEWEFSVKDNGPGIAPEYHERVWGIFQTLEARDKVEGAGIGLSLVRKIVEHRGGRSWIASKLGEGATFLFTWPKTYD